MIANATLRVVTIGNLRILAVIDRQYGNLCLGMKSVEDVGDRPDFDTDSASTVDVASLASGRVVRFLTVNGETFICNGWDANKILSGTTIRDAGANAAAAPTISAGAAGSLTGSYSALYTYYDSARGYETSPAATAPTAISLTSQTLNVAVVANADTRFDKIRIYRNANAVPGTYRYDQEVSNTTQTVVSSQADTALGDEVSYGNYVPPACKFVAKTATRIFWGGTEPFTEGTATVTNGSTTVTLTEAAPPNMYTRNSEAPFYFQKKNGPRYGISSISGNTLTLSTAYKGTSEAGISFSISGLSTQVYYADLSDLGLVKAESWSTSNRFLLGLPGDVGTKDLQDEITGMMDYGNKLYVWMKESVWLFDPLITQRKKTAAPTGTLSDKTIQMNRDGYLLYMGTDMQVYAFNGSTCRMLSDKVRNRFADQDRYNFNLMQFAFARYEEREGFYELYRPAANATLYAMRYVVDVWDEYTGRWTERVPPRISASCKVRDKTKVQHIGIDTLGLVHVLNDYENSVSFEADAFSSHTFSPLTSVAGEISPGANRKGKVAVVFDSTSIKGSKFIVGTQTATAQTEDLTDAVTVAAGDQYNIGAWHAIYETGWMDLGDPASSKIFYFLEGTFIKNSSGYLYVSWYTDETATAVDTIRITVASERSFKRNIPCRGRQIKFKFESVSDLAGWGLRDLTLYYRTTGL